MDWGAPPKEDEFELTLFGPGYGESIVLHIGGGAWAIVDSCIDGNGKPTALAYLEHLGLDPAESVALVVATHWHDDHIRGMAELLGACGKADFCCAGALCRREFLSVVGAMESRRISAAGSGVREIHDVFTRLKTTASKPKFALANRLVFKRGECEIRSLSPDDAAFEKFLSSIGHLVPAEGRTKTRVPGLSPNEIAVALWIGIGDFAVLLGSDLEKPGWLSVLRSPERPEGKASAFKIPHHGSANADEPEVWKHMVEQDPVAALTPWRRGGRALPSGDDVRRILSYTGNAYGTARGEALGSRSRRRHGAVDKTLRESGVSLRRLAMSSGAVRLRRPLASSARWKVETLGSAHRLERVAA